MTEPAAAAAALVAGWSDDLFLAGHHLGRWLTDYVDLEECLALGSMAQDDLAHAGVLIGLCGVSVEARDERIFARPASAWGCSALTAPPPTSWPEVVAAGACLAAGSTVLLDWLAGSSRDDVRQAAGLLGLERSLHAAHWERWLSLFAGAEGTRAELDASLAVAVARSLDLFGRPVAFDGVDLGVPLDRETLHAAWVARMRSLLSSHGYVVAAGALGPARPRDAAGRSPELAAAADEIQRLRRDAAAVYLVYR
jgi:1,2-phenylacetyl-CoA epoxidase catalytic subunit